MPPNIAPDANRRASHRRIDPLTRLLPDGSAHGIEMDAILCVVIYGSPLGSGRFKLSGSAPCAYAMKLPSADIKAVFAIAVF